MCRARRNTASGHNKRFRTYKSRRVFIVPCDDFHSDSRITFPRLSPKNNAATSAVVRRITRNRRQKRRQATICLRCPAAPLRTSTLIMNAHDTPKRSLDQLDDCISLCPGSECCYGTLLPELSQDSYLNLFRWVQPKVYAIIPYKECLYSEVRVEMLSINDLYLNYIYSCTGLSGNASRFGRPG